MFLWWVELSPPNQYIQVIAPNTCRSKSGSISCSVMSDSWTHGHSLEAPLSMEYWSGQLFPSPGYLPNSGIKPGSPAMQADSLLSEPPRNMTSIENRNFVDVIQLRWGCIGLRWTLSPMTSIFIEERGEDSVRYTKRRWPSEDRDRDGSQVARNQVTPESIKNWKDQGRILC